jgi:hypothetical protein
MIAILGIAIISTAAYLFFGRDILRKSTIFAFTFEINSISSGTYDAGQSEVSVRYTLKIRSCSIQSTISSNII